MKIKSIGIGLAFLFILSGLTAAPITLEKAQKTAEKFYGVQIQKAAAKSLPVLSCIYPKETKSNEFVPFYIFNAGQEQGFVIVAGDDNAARLVLGYSDQGSFQTEDMPDNLKYWLEYYAEGVRNAAIYGGSGNLQAKADFAKAETVKEPLLGEINYNQGAPYNDLCPIDPTTNRLSYTGCVATALTSVARYYGYPKQGRGRISYTTSTRKIPLSMDFSENTYDWDNMLDTYRGNLSQYTEVQRTAVATLMRDMGYAVRMDYTSNASGALRDPTTTGMYDFMGFDSILEYRERMYYDNDEEWIAVLKENLDNDLPVYYSGTGDGGGHAFVCDGYDEDNFFHINWGWGGMSNGYFTVQNLDPDNTSGIGAGTGGGYSSNQSILHNLVPPGHKHSDDLFVLTTSSSNITLAQTKEDSIYSIEETPMSVSFRALQNHSMSYFKGTIAMAAYQNGELIKVISNKVPLEIDKQKSSSGTFYLFPVLDSLEEGEYELWIVAATDASSEKWHKVYINKSNRLNTISYIPVRVGQGTYQLVKYTATLTVNVDCADTRNISMFIFSNNELIGTGQVSALQTKIFNYRYGHYDLRFWTRGYDTTYVSLDLTKDTAIEIYMQERYVNPYLRGVRVEGNKATVMWYKNASYGETAYPTGFAVFLDDVEVAQLASTATEYTITDIPLGEHWAGLTSIYKTGRSDTLLRSFTIRETANEKAWNGLCRITPNPSATGYFMVETDRDCRLQVSDLSGRVVLERELAAGSQQVDMNGYGAGVYLFRLSGKDGESAVLKAVLK